MGNNSGLAAARTGEDEQRPLDGLYRFPLCWIQPLKDIHLVAHKVHYSTVGHAEKDVLQPLEREPRI